MTSRRGSPTVEANGVAAALDRELDEVLRIEVERVGREARAAGVLDALVDGQDAHVAGAAEAPVVVERLQVAQHLRVAVGLDEDALDEVGAGQVQIGRGERRRTCGSAGSRPRRREAPRGASWSVPAVATVSSSGSVSTECMHRRVSSPPDGAPLHRAQLHDRHRRGADDLRRQVVRPGERDRVAARGVARRARSSPSSWSRCSRSRPIRARTPSRPASSCARCAGRSPRRRRARTSSSARPGRTRSRCGRTSGSSRARATAT